VDAARAVLVGRVWRHGEINGPCVVAVRGGEVVDISAHAPTMSDLLERRCAGYRPLRPGRGAGPVQDLLAAALRNDAGYAGAPRRWRRATCRRSRLAA
jgi:fumarylacetoacetate (FAA) hydrolase family protein